MNNVNYKVVRTLRCRNANIPGTLGKLATTIGQAGAEIGNIGTVHLGHHFTIRDIEVLIDSEKDLEKLLALADLAPAIAGALVALPSGGAESLAAIADAAGRPYVVRAAAGGQAQLLPAGPAPASWIGIDLAGKDPPMPDKEWANLAGIGSTVEVKFGDHTGLAQMTGTGAGGASGPSRIWFDLEGAAKVDYVRILWPDGVLQSEPGLASGKIHRIGEIQRKPTSCPIVFVWDGARYRYVADFLGVGGLGYLEAPGVFSKPDPTEVLELPALVPAKGPGGEDELRVSLVEPLEECTYLDALELAAVDSPEGVTVHPEEMFPVKGPAPL